MPKLHALHESSHEQPSYANGSGGRDIKARWRRTLVATMSLVAVLLAHKLCVAQQLWFETPKKDACIREGVREWSAIVTGQNYNGDWVVACQQTTALIEGAQRTSRDCGWNGGRVWGKFDVPDPTCPKQYTVGCGGGGCAVGSTSDAPLGALGVVVAALTLTRLRRRLRSR